WSRWRSAATSTRTAASAPARKPDPRGASSDRATAPRVRIARRVSVAAIADGRAATSAESPCAGRLTGMAKSPARGGKRPGDKDITRNRQAAFRYELLDTTECGVQLAGTEVKSLRDGGAHLRDAYAILKDGELWLVGAHIPPYGAAAQ